MPKIVDEGKRKAQIAEAVLSIATEHGLAAATIRAVSDRCGLSVGAIQHYFPSQAKLQCFSMELLAKKVTQRTTDTAIEPENDPLKTVTTLLEQILPLDNERMLEARVWAMFTTSSLTNADLVSCEQQMNESIHSFCLRCIEYLNEHFPALRRKDACREAYALQAFLDGLTLRLLVETKSETENEVRCTLREYLRTICGIQ